MSNNRSTTLISFLIALLIFATGKPGFGKIVHYIDEYGKIHYVNTKYFEVPLRYRDQVEDQLKDSDEDITDVDSETEDKEGEKKEILTTSEPVKVEIFTENNCKNSHILKSLLKAFRIKYQEYNVKTDPYGRKIYESIGGNLPITIVGDHILHGANIKKVQNALKESQGHSSDEE